MSLKYKVRKLLQQNNQKIALRFLKIILIFFVLASALIIFKDFSASFFNGSSDIKNDILSTLSVYKSRSAKAGSSVVSDVNYTAITKNSIFGKFSSEKTDQNQNVKISTGEMPLALIGTVLTKGTSPYAIIEDTKNKIQDAFSIGDSIFSIATLMKIYKNKVEIKINDGIEILSIDDFDADDGDSDSSGPVVFLDATEVQKTLENLPLIMTQARAIPFWQEGKPIGLRLFAIKSGSIFEKLGLKNGDILKNINGKQLGDFSKAMEIFEELKHETSLKIQLERSKKATTLQYKIR